MGAEHVPWEWVRGAPRGPLEALPTWSSRSDPSSVPRPSRLRGDDDFRWRSPAHGGGVTARGGASQLALQEPRVGPNCCAVCVCVTAESTRTLSRGVTGGGPDDPFVATACASWMAAARRQAP